LFGCRTKAQEEAQQESREAGGHLKGSNTYIDLSILQGVRAGRQSKHRDSDQSCTHIQRNESERRMNKFQPPQDKGIDHLPAL
jgi:hypothetical protein